MKVISYVVVPQDCEKLQAFLSKYPDLQELKMWKSAFGKTAEQTAILLPSECVKEWLKLIKDELQEAEMHAWLNPESVEHSYGNSEARNSFLLIKYGNYDVKTLAKEWEAISQEPFACNKIVSIVEMREYHEEGNDYVEFYGHTTQPSWAWENVISNISKKFTKSAPIFFNAERIGG